MKKVIFQGLILISLFFSTWLLLYQLNWMSIFKVEQTTKFTEEKLGNLFWEVYRKSEKEINNQFINKSIDSLVNKICKENKINLKNIKVHLIENNEVNAFALPNGHLVIYTGLIKNAANQEELIGVICHEIAHIELNHVMNKLMKEVGLSVLISMTTNSANTTVVSEAVKLLSSTAFDRQLENEADLEAVNYLIMAKINPQHLAHFLNRISKDENKSLKYFNWISTHPESQKRAANIIGIVQNKSLTNVQIISQQTWYKIKEIIN